MPSKVHLRFQEGQHPIALLLHVVVLVDDLRVDMGDYVDGVLLRQALRRERPRGGHYPARRRAVAGPLVHRRGCYHSGR